MRIQLSRGNNTIMEGVFKTVSTVRPFERLKYLSSLPTHAMIDTISSRRLDAVDARTTPSSATRFTSSIPVGSVAYKNRTILDRIVPEQTLKPRRTSNKQPENSRTLA